jgi:hypothetical protein
MTTTNGIIYRNYQSLKIIANGVNVLIENRDLQGKNVPIMAAGTAIAGINVDLKSCEKYKLPREPVRMAQSMLKCHQ